MDKLLEVKNLKKTFSLGNMISKVHITAVDDISFFIEPGEIFALAGESGCGKTTTARIILGFEEATSGAILHNGEVADPKHDKVWHTKGVQAIFQDPFGTFNPLRTVDSYFFDTVRNYKLARTRESTIGMIDRVLKQVGLSYEEFAGKYPNEFSGGQLQRGSIARALITNPGLIIADEPVSMVDASLRMSIVNLFKSLQNDLGVSVLYITHDLATAYYMCNRIAIMFRGNIVEMGSVEKVLLEPKHPYTRLLRESIPEADPNKRWKGSISLAELETEEYLRKGCKFAGRCPNAMEICKGTVPPELQVDGVLVKCHLYGENSTPQPAAGG